MSKLVMKYITNAIVGACLGGILDFFFSTGILLSLIGAVAGIVITLLIK